MRTTTIRVDDDLLKLTKEIARRNGISTADVIRRELRNKVDEQAAINPKFAAYAAEIGRRRYEREKAATAETIGMFATAHYRPRPMEPPLPEEQPNAPPSSSST